MPLPDGLDPLEQHLLDGLINLDRPNAGSSPARLRPTVAAELFEAQAGSRIVDHTARWLRSTHGIGYYTIGSAGHEANAAVALALRPTDPALLHYRSGGFYFGRASQVPGSDPTLDVLRGMLALSTDPIAGGRHKVFGSKGLGVIPQTSTIASHLPRAVGLAVSLGWGDPALHAAAWPADSVVVCSFGDASLNHSTAQGAINWAANAAYRGQRVPLLFVCEDNGLGISVPTPQGWVGASTATRVGLNYRFAASTNPAAVLSAASELAGSARSDGRPGLLHLETVRFLGHAGTDVEAAYRHPADQRDDLERDPLLASAAEVVAGGDCSGADLVAWYLDARAETRDRALRLAADPAEPELLTAAEVMAPLTEPRQAGTLAAQVLGSAAELAGDEPLTLAQTINYTLAGALTVSDRAIVFGEDVGRKGGVYGVTRGLQAQFGEQRVFDTILDEQTVLGLALGAGLNGYLPIPEIQYLAYLHNAEDQLRGEAATLGFFSQGQFANPMVMRVAAYAYQRGFGGHFHNDNSVAVLLDIPGVIVASPSHPSDAAPMLAACLQTAATDGSVCVYLEPIARYHDAEWTAPLSVEPVEIGSARTHFCSVSGEEHGTILTWGNGLFLSLGAQRRLLDEHGQRWRVVDLRWLAPLPEADLLAAATATGNVLIVDETRARGGVGEAIVSSLIADGFTGPVSRVAAKDSFIPLGAAANLVLVDEDQIVAAATGSCRNEDH